MGACCRCTQSSQDLDLPSTWDRARMRRMARTIISSAEVPAPKVTLPDYKRIRASFKRRREMDWRHGQNMWRVFEKYNTPEKKRRAWVREWLEAQGIKIPCTVTN